MSTSTTSSGDINPIVLDYGDYIIRSSEVDILKGPNWLNDVIIGFYIEYLTREVLLEEVTNIKIVGPEMAQLLKMCSYEDLPNLLGDLSRYNFVFFPVNNADDPEQVTIAGSHWSLLVYSRGENVLAHFDSSFGSNNNSAEALARHVSNAITPKPVFTCRGCAPQINGYDCGLHVLANIETISAYVLKCKVLNGVHTAKSQTAGLLRTKIAEIIESKASLG